MESPSRRALHQTIGFRTRWIGVLLLTVLLASRLVFLVPSFLDLIIGKGGVDLSARRAELEWVMHGVSPYLALQRLRLERSREEGASTSPASLEPSELPGLEEISVGAFSAGDFSHVNSAIASYPHWSYPLFAPLVWPPWPSTAIFFAGVLALSLAGFLWLATRPFCGWWRWLAVLVCLIPMPAWSVAVFTGQFSIPLMFLLVLYALALERGRWVTAGLLLGFASLKPTFTMLFAGALLAPILSGEAKWPKVVRAAGTATALILFSSGLVWWRVGVEPWTALRGLVNDNIDTATMGYGLLPLVVRSGLGGESAAVLFAVMGICLAGLVPWFLRRHSMLSQIAILGLLSRLWAYHRHYDDVLLVFLLLALLVEVRRGSLLALGGLLCMATTLASPIPTSDWQEAWRISVWIVAAVVLLWEERAGLVERQPEPPRSGARAR